MKRKGVNGKKKMKKQSHKVRSKDMLQMLLNRKDGVHHNRAKDVKRGSSRKPKHKNRQDH